MTLNTLGKTTEEIQDIVGSLIGGSGDINVTYDDANNQLSIDVSTLTNEGVQDTVASLVASDSNLSWSYDDANDTLTVSLSNLISVSSLEADEIIDGANVSHTGRLANQEKLISQKNKLDNLRLDFALDGLGMSNSFVESFADLTNIVNSAGTNIVSGVDGYVELDDFISVNETVNDGKSYTYNAPSSLSLSSLDVSLTGVTNTNNKTVSKNTGSVSTTANVGGNLDATNASISLTGNTQTDSKSAYGGVSAGNTTENISPSGDTSLNNRQIEFNATVPSASDSTFGSLDSSDTIGNLTVYADDVNASEVQVIVDADINAYYHDLSINGGSFASIDLDKGDYTKTYTFSGRSAGTYDYQLEALAFSDGSSVSVTIKHVAGNPSQVDVNPDNGGSSSYSIQPNTNYTKSIDIDRNTQSVDVSVDSGDLDYTISWDETHYTENPSVTFNGNTYSPGNLNDGQTQQYDLATLSPGSKPLDVSVEGGGKVNVDLSFTERTVTKDPSVTINGSTKSHSGSLTNGSTTSLGFAKGDIVNGGNNISVSLTNPSNGPQMNVDLSIVAVTNTGIIQLGTFDTTYVIKQMVGTATIRNGSPTDINIVVEDANGNTFVIDDTNIDTFVEPPFNGQNANVRIEIYDYSAEIIDASLFTNDVVRQ